LTFAINISLCGKCRARGIQYK